MCSSDLIRESLASEGALTAAWLARTRVFDASVQVCALVWARGGAPGPRSSPLATGNPTAEPGYPRLDADSVGASSSSTGIRPRLSGLAGPVSRAVDLPPEPLPPAPAPTGPSWAPLFADARGAPTVHIQGAGQLRDIASATADFRDEYYGLVPWTIDAEHADEVDFPRLVLTGHIDCAHAAWGERAVRFGKRPWMWPRIERSGLKGTKLDAWATRRLRPKVLLATQTRVLEAVADPAGTWLTTTPTISVFPESTSAWHVAAVLSAPAVSAWALTTWGGTALAAQAIKLSARQVLEIPLPADRGAWDEAAARIEVAHAHPDHLDGAIRLLDRAYSTDLYDWWRARR